MSKIRINYIKIKNYRSFGNKEQQFYFPDKKYSKPVAIIGYNNAGKTNLMNSLRFGLYESIREDTFELNDFHNCNFLNSPEIELNFTASLYGEKHLYNNVSTSNRVIINSDENRIISVEDFCEINKYSKIGLLSRQHRYII